MKNIIITDLTKHNIVQFPINIKDHGTRITIHETVQVLGCFTHNNQLVEVNCNQDSIINVHIFKYKLIKTNKNQGYEKRKKSKSRS